jgi:Flp pilus assembly protein TadD
VTLDTTRADHLGPYGYPDAETPTLDALARDGATFLQAYSTCPLTIPSHSTILTGLYPRSHGVLDNGDFLLGEDAVTLAERFKAVGYHTAAFTSAFPTQARWGFAQGFDVFHDPLRRAPTQRDWSDQRTAGHVITDALETLAPIAGPVFAWVHLFDPHWPYAPPEPYKSRHAHPYDGEIAYADAELGRLLAGWDQARADGIVVVTADHGEGLGDGGEITHGYLLHDGTLHVPLIVRGPGVAAGARIADPVGHPDLVPTLLRMAAITVPPELPGRDLFAGGSDEILSEARTGLYSLGLSALTARTDGAGRYTEGVWGAFYPRLPDGSIATAPGERRPDDAARLAALETSLPMRTAPPVTLDADAFQQLAALGYVGGAEAHEASDVDPRDVIATIPKTWQARQALAAHKTEVARKLSRQISAAMPGTFGADLIAAEVERADGDLDGARARMVALFERSPGSTLALQIAGLEASVGDGLEAEHWYEEALAIQPMSPEAMTGLVRTALDLGDSALARQRIDAWLPRYPDHLELRMALALLLLDEGRVDEARAQADWALLEAPGLREAHSLQARVLWAQGHADQAIDRIQAASNQAPFDIGIRVILTQYLLEVGRNAEAVRAIHPLVSVGIVGPEILALDERARLALAAEVGAGQPGPGAKETQP